jgi:hypothetical protein
MPTELEWAEAFRRLDSGESSYEAEAKASRRWKRHSLQTPYSGAPAQNKREEV